MNVQPDGFREVSERLTRHELGDDLIAPMLEAAFDRLRYDLLKKNPKTADHLYIAFNTLVDPTAPIFMNFHFHYHESFLALSRTFPSLPKYLAIWDDDKKGYILASGDEIAQALDGASDGFSESIRKAFDDAAELAPLIASAFQQNNTSAMLERWKVEEQRVGGDCEIF